MTLFKLLLFDTLDYLFGFFPDISNSSPLLYNMSHVKIFLSQIITHSFSGSIGE